MRQLLAIPVVILTSCSTAQEPSALPRAAELLSTHFGAEPLGTPLSINWKPQGADAKHFTFLEFGTVITTMDTILYPSSDLALVFFRTAPKREPLEWETTCALCEDWIGLAKYQKQGEVWKLLDFNKWFCKQGIYTMASQPELVEVGAKARVVRIISSDGEPEHSSTVHHLLSIPDMGNALTVTVEGIEVTRGGPHGPMEAMVMREYRFIPSTKEWYDMELTTRTEEGGEGKMSLLSYSAATKTYGTGKAPVK